jgi:hypothetical protein
MATAPLTISVSDSAFPRHYTLFIFANSTLGSSLEYVLPAIATSQFTTTVDVQPGLTYLDKLGLGFSGIPVNIPKEYLLGFYGIVLSLVIPGIVRFFNGRRQAAYVSKYMTAITSIYDSLCQNKDECERRLENVKKTS